MSLKHRLTRLEGSENPQGPTVYDVSIADPGESDEERQSNIARLRASGHLVYDIRLPLPSEE